MGGVIGSCFGSCCAQCACSACDRVSKGGSLVPYFVLLFASTILAIILRYWGGPMLVHLYFTDYLLCDTAKCVGYGAVFRISFALALFFLGHALFLLASSCHKIDHYSWAIKLPIFLLLLVASYFLPDQFYDGYVHVARVIAGVFLLLQIVILIDFAYKINEDWTSEEKNWKAAVLIVSLIFYILSIVACVLCFVYFAASGCTLQRFFTGFTIALTVLVTILSISPFVDRGGLLPAAVITLYCWWLNYSSLSSDPSSCNTANSNSTAQLIIGLAIGAASITYAAWSVSTSDSWNDKEDVDVELEGSKGKKDEVKDDEEKQATVPAPPKGSSNADVDEMTDEQKVEKAKQRMRFHLSITCACMYMAMLLTNWGSRQHAESDGTEGSSYDLSIESMWIKIVTQWITCALFAWSLIASRVFPDRDFE